MMAHEMGHYVLGHVVRSVLLSTLGILASLFVVDRVGRLLIGRFRERFGFDRLSDVASVPLLLLLMEVTSLVVIPVAFAYSRHQEHEADRFALELTRTNRSGALAFVKLREREPLQPPAEPHLAALAGHPPQHRGADRLLQCVPSLDPRAAPEIRRLVPSLTSPPVQRVFRPSPHDRDEQDPAELDGSPLPAHNTYRSVRTECGDAGRDGDGNSGQGREGRGGPGDRAGGGEAVRGDRVRRDVGADDRQGGGGDEADALLPLREQGRAGPGARDRADDRADRPVAGDPREPGAIRSPRWSRCSRRISPSAATIPTGPGSSTPCSSGRWARGWRPSWPGSGRRCAT